MMYIYSYFKYITRVFVWVCTLVCLTNYSTRTNSHFQTPIQLVENIFSYFSDKPIMRNLIL